MLPSGPSGKQQEKRQMLRRQGTLNQNAPCVTHALFQNNEFFDANDLVQVKYEMLRHVHVDRYSVRESAEAFGFSRPSFYQAQAAFEKHGVSGLMPHKRGPQGGHKITREILEFIKEQRAADPTLTDRQLADCVQERFQVRVHPRTIQRQLLRQAART